MDKEARRAQWALRGGDWLFSFRQVRMQAFSIINRICPTHSLSLDDDFTAFKRSLEALAEGSHPYESAFMEALESLPGILERMKATLKSDVREVRQVQKFEVNALDAFIKACELGIAWVQDPQKRGSEAAMFFRFSRAWKWWRASNKVESAFWNKVSSASW